MTPVVSVGNYGIAGLATGVNPLSVPLVCSSLSVTTGGNNGGYLISMSGHGFPLSNPFANELPRFPPPIIVIFFIRMLLILTVILFVDPNQTVCSYSERPGPMHP